MLKIANKLMSYQANELVLVETAGIEPACERYIRMHFHA